ncbi:MAG: asparaginase domain-containing protein [Candidatus Caldarchaeum sp.]
MAKHVHVLATGGTILSKTFDAKAGAEILSYKQTFPEISVEGVDYEIREIMVKASFDFTPSDWQAVANSVYKSLQEGVDGVVVLHGTDTLQYTASALSFMLGYPEVPVVLTGAMIPGGNPGSDGPGNVKAALRVAAYADLGHVCVVFSEDAFGGRKVIIKGTRAKKIHSHALNAFASVNEEPLGHVVGETIHLDVKKRVRRGESRAYLKTELNPNVGLIKMTPSLTDEAMAKILSLYDGVVVEGTGLGHIKSDDKFIGVVEDYGRPVVITTQCLYGGEKLGVYALDKKILAVKNIIPTSDMLPETALVKLMWCLGQGGDVRSLMLSNIAGEISDSYKYQPKMS